ncbi:MULTISPECIES: hypothetical protein [Actinosynnema]|uniref:hypothetical protein n=1 Tax=Actinosynnema TaxID=40566 RepID=UPI0020A4B3AE|nr:hypothetical protein [Actinosynnema pretiosum]MCP2097373.1 hypothetical protein [Actinosynnema pretiosum]
MDLYCALINLENGALVRGADDGDACQARWYDFSRLRRLFTTAADQPPHLIALNEAKEYHTHGRHALNHAAEVLSTTLGRRYVGLAGSLSIGPFGPVLFYDATELVLDYWGDTHESVPLDKRNLARLHVYGQRGTDFEIMLDHWPFWSGSARLERARYLSGAGTSATPRMLVGDNNETASGPHLPQRDWYAEGVRHRHHKGKFVDGRWQAHTDALDCLIGAWRGGCDGYREESEAGFYAAEEAAGVTGSHAEAALRATVNIGIDKGGPLLIDWALHNTAWRGGVVPGSVRVEIPPDDRPFDSDHRRKTWTMQLDRG